jgi:hypothetical protein
MRVSLSHPRVLAELYHVPGIDSTRAFMQATFSSGKKESDLEDNRMFPICLIKKDGIIYGGCFLAHIDTAWSGSGHRFPPPDVEEHYEPLWNQ